MEKKIYYKGFDKNFQCRGFQYEIGKSYTHEGEITLCKSGFHACGYPLSVFDYYAPADSRFAKVEASGKIVPGDDKIACEKLKIKAEISLNAMITAAVKFTLSKIKKSKTATNTGDYSVATNTGNYSVATVAGKDSISCGLGYKCKAKGAKGCCIS